MQIAHLPVDEREITLADLQPEDLPRWLRDWLAIIELSGIKKLLDAPQTRERWAVPSLHTLPEEHWLIACLGPRVAIQFVRYCGGERYERLPRQLLLRRVRMRHWARQLRAAADDGEQRQLRQQWGITETWARKLKTLPIA